MSALTLELIIRVLAAVALLLALRIYLILPRGYRRGPMRKPGEKYSLGVFLGSGGHTAEMRTLLLGLDFNRYTPRTYVYCPGDDMSLRMIKELESTKGSPVNSYSFTQLPRARRVAQSLLSTVGSSLVTLCAALCISFLRPLATRPTEPWVDVLLVNGPGTCVLVVAVSWIRRILGLRHTKIVYVESFARVKSLSLSGKILRPFVDTFVVQWPIAGSTVSRAGQVGSSAKVGDGAVRVVHRDSSLGGTRPVIHRGWLV